MYPGYAQPVYGSGCYWASQPVYDGLGGGLCRIAAARYC